MLLSPLFLPHFHIHADARTCTCSCIYTCFHTGRCRSVDVRWTQCLSPMGCFIWCFWIISAGECNVRLSTFDLPLILLFLLVLPLSVSYTHTHTRKTLHEVKHWFWSTFVQSHGFKLGIRWQIRAGDCSHNEDLDNLDIGRHLLQTLTRKLFPDSWTFVGCRLITGHCV